LSRMVSAQALAVEPKWTRFPARAVREKPAEATVGDFFVIKRGLVTGDNRYFILTREQMRDRDLPREVFRPILPGPRHLPSDQVESDGEGCPLSQRQLFLLDVALPEAEIERRFPALFAYLQEGRRRRLHERYLCQHRSPWYSQEKRAAAPIVCTYLGRGDTLRGRPFRFILNRSRATAANVYLLMYPTEVLACAIEREPSLLDRVWAILNDLAPAALLEEGRVYGGGLHKLEPRELASVPVPRLTQMINSRCSAGSPRCPDR
jgi:adenine-specific DNA-methyltransferase